MVHYIHPTLLVEACSPESTTYNLGTMLVEVIATVLDNEVSYSLLLCLKKFHSGFYLIFLNLFVLIIFYY